MYCNVLIDRKSLLRSGLQKGEILTGIFTRSLAYGHPIKWAESLPQLHNTAKELIQFFGKPVLYTPSEVRDILLRVFSFKEGKNGTQHNQVKSTRNWTSVSAKAAVLIVTFSCS